MKSVLPVLVMACLLVGCSQSVGEDISETDSSPTRVLAFKKQRPVVRTKCFPDELRAILRHIKQTTGVRPVVTSGHRPHGRRTSQHFGCKAADIRVPGYSSSRIKEIVRGAPFIGGIGTYSHKPGLVHVDVGSRREWRH